ncbi:hypothetical protein SAMN04487830_10143 [Pseudobutyrivibrio sp. OR37]|uniref:hypothetical protein n=1 Tax=Pseudobutyrivibrio sp. OR37 TaxID=1798186 RepID=UPI0008EEA9A3|nr:hypothetical protein [Pseudobutyrivibrio sp. OR37]SFH52307.1 hypothetical protein SAMN04487830_10143 [Pseudobutyrivibrio sp. OR37]
MKIENSHVNMASSHNSYSITHVEQLTIERRANVDALGAILKLSEEGEKSYKESLEQLQKNEEDTAKKRQQENLQNMFRQMAEHDKQIREANAAMSQWDMEDLQVSLVKKILDLLNGKNSPTHKKLSEQMKSLRDLQGRIMGGCETEGVKFSLNGSEQKTLNLSSAESVSRTQVWQRITATSGTHLEYENTTFASTGEVQTSDGRSLSFNVELAFGRSLVQKIDTLKDETYTRILTDPLVINMDTNLTSISDQKFKFDIDSDGDEEEISFTGKGSGFLALDKNEDGKINDGSELFGTKSGDGFKDLSEYDEDNNGWIDENDTIFNKLKVWTKDEEGNDKLLSLKEADVGAIYLGNINTEFSYKDGIGNTDAVLRKSGIYLKESTGAAGTVAHVDLAL